MPLSTNQSVRRLFRIRNRFGDDAALEKLQLLQSLSEAGPQCAAGIRLLHDALCFIRAFPDSDRHFRIAGRMLARFGSRIGILSDTALEALVDSGIANSSIRYEFSFEVALWLAKNAPGCVSIDWEEIEDTTRFDELLEQLIAPAELDYFDSGYASSEEWLRLAACGSGMTDFDWLMAQLQQKSRFSIWMQLYNAAELPLVWSLGESEYSKTLCALPVRRVPCHHGGMRKSTRDAKSEIMRPFPSLRKLTPRTGRRMIDVAMAALAVRHRETYHFNFANPKEVHVADIGKGTSIAVFGLRPEHRFPLECTMGYLILANGRPVGYGGGSALFRQVNTGINLFDEYRDSEASYFPVQVMRFYHQLFGCSRFIANAYQFGDDNSDALRSGAFWFYYKLGYRPVLPAIRRLAQREAARKKRNRSYRCTQKVLRRLASCDMHLTLPGARECELFDESWIETCSMLATQELAAAGGKTRSESEDRLMQKVAKQVGLRSIDNWTRDETLALRRLAPIVAVIKPSAWSADAKRSLRELLRAKGQPGEAGFARLLGQHDYFLAELRRRCRRCA